MKAPATIMPDNGICERFHRTLLDKFYRVAFRKRIYRSIDELQADLDAWIATYNEQWPHQGRCALARRRCKPPLTHFLWRRRNVWSAPSLQGSLGSDARQFA